MVYAPNLPDCCTPTADASLEERAYCAYLTVTGGRNYQGLPCPKWTELPETIRLAWRAAADTVAKRSKPESRSPSNP